MTFHIAIIGCGNIGSPLADMLARQPEIQRFTLVDRDVFTRENLTTQAIHRSDVGRAKTAVIARHIRALRPDARVTAHSTMLERLPLGALMCDAICGCLNSRVSRTVLNEIAFCLGVPYIDAGVHGAELMARVDVFVPGPDSPCMECAFGDATYGAMESSHPCRGGVPQSAPSGAPAFLGAFAAAIQSAAVMSVLTGGSRGPQSGSQLIYELKTHQHYINKNRRNPACRFDHRIYAPESISSARTLRSIIGPSRTVAASETLAVPGQSLLYRAACPQCGQPILKTMPAHETACCCSVCGAGVPAHPFELADRVRVGDLPDGVLGRTLRSLGVRTGDVCMTSRGGVDRCFMVGAAAKANRRIRGDE